MPGSFRWLCAPLLVSVAGAGCFFPGHTIVTLADDDVVDDTGRPQSQDTFETPDAEPDGATDSSQEERVALSGAVVALRMDDLIWTGVAVGAGVLVSVTPQEARGSPGAVRWKSPDGTAGLISPSNVHQFADGLLVLEVPEYAGETAPLSDGVGVSGPDLVIGHPTVTRGLGGWIPFVPRYDGEDPGLVIAPADTGLDGAPVFTGCGGVKALLAPGPSRSQLSAPPEAAPAGLAMQPSPATACFGGKRQTIPATRIQSALRDLGLASVAPDGCRQPVETGRQVYEPPEPLALDAGAAALLARIRHSVVWVAGLAGAASSDWEAVLAPSSTAREIHEVHLDDGTVLGPTPFSNFRVIGNGLAISYWQGARDEGLVSGSAEELSEGDSVYLVGHTQAVGCGLGWTVSTLRFTGRTPGSLYFAGSVYSEGGAVVTSTGELLGLATACATAAPVDPEPAPEGSGLLPLDPGCAILVSTLPEDDRP